MADLADGRARDRSRSRTRSSDGAHAHVQIHGRWRSRSRSPNVFEVSVVNSMTGAEICKVNASFHWKTSHLSRKICRELEIPYGVQHFLLGDRRLRDDELLCEVRRRSALWQPGEPLILSLVRVNEGVQPGWMRLESLHREGVYFYSHTSSGETRSEPPEPWIKLASRHNRGMTYHYNSVTGQTSVDKPVIVLDWPHSATGLRQGRDFH